MKLRSGNSTKRGSDDASLASFITKKISKTITSAGRKKLVLDGDDIICGLPRHVLDKIYERLPVRDAARTSILSRKWRYLWSASPYLVFDQQFFEKTIANKPKSAIKYVNVINKVLFGHDGPVLNFDLYIPNLVCEWDEHIDGWLLFLSRNGIQKLSLDCRRPTSYKLPSYIFSSRKLTNLKLVNIIFKPPVSFSGFANLVELHCYKITFAACSFNGVSPVAPLLKNLIFKKCTDIKYFNISAPQAMSIAVSHSNEVPLIFFDKFPNLYGICIIVGELPKVANQRSPISLCELHEKFPTILVLMVDGGYLNLSGATTIKRSLSFGYHDLAFLGLSDLSFDDLDQISCVLWLLNSSPNLTDFQAVVSPSKSTIVESVLNHLESPGCIGKMLKLQTVKLELAEGSKPELVFIKCILAHSPNLESLYVNFRVANMDQRLKISNELMRFPRESNKAEVIYRRWSVGL